MQINGPDTREQDRRDAMREAYEKVLAICAECDDVVLVEDAVRGLIADLD